MCEIAISHLLEWIGGDVLSAGPIHGLGCTHEFARVMPEALIANSVGREFIRQDLHGDITAKTSVVGAINFTHSALAQSMIRWCEILSPIMRIPASAIRLLHLND
jgi:hypothetical protein